MPPFPKLATSTATLSAGVFSELQSHIQASPHPIVPLHVGDTWRDPIEAAWSENQRLADWPRLHTYSPPQGEKLLLDAIQAKVARHTGVTIPRESLCVTAGASSGLSIVIQTLLNPGDEVLLPSPFWPLIRGIISSRGGVPVEIPFWTRLDDPTFDLEAALEAQITPRTVALYLNSPHNPTGQILDASQAAACARVAKKHDLWIICDEAYEDLIFTPDPDLPLWTRPDFRDRSIIAHTLSKSYGFAGGRIGYLHGPATAMKAIMATQTHQVYCASQPMQMAATHLLNDGDAWMDESRALYHQAAQETARTFGVPTPPGGTFLFVDARPWLPPDATDAYPFLVRCLEKAGILLTPGQASGIDFPTWVRVCFTSIPPQALTAALSNLRILMETPA